MAWLRSLSAGRRTGLIVALVVLAVISFLAGSRMLPSSSSTASELVRDRDTDASTLVSESEEASRRAREVASDAVLRQADVDPATGRTGFRFASAVLSQELVVIAPSVQPDAQWEVRVVGVSPVSTQTGPGLDVSMLNVGPAASAQAMAGHWPSCTPRGLTLAAARGALTWYAFCNLQDGSIAAGTVDGRTGEFQPSAAPPAKPPPTAMPNP